MSSITALADTPAFFIKLVDVCLSRMLKILLVPEPSQQLADAAVLPGSPLAGRVSRGNVMTYRYDARYVENVNTYFNQCLQVLYVDVAPLTRTSWNRIVDWLKQFQLIGTAIPAQAGCLFTAM